MSDSTTYVFTVTSRIPLDVDDIATAQYYMARAMSDLHGDDLDQGYTATLHGELATYTAGNHGTLLLAIPLGVEPTTGVTT